MGPMVSLLKEAGTCNIMSDRVTMEFVLEKLSKGFPRVSPNGNQTLKMGFEASALIVSSELAVFLTASQFTVISLTDLWDCKEGVYGYGTRGKGEFNINSPNLCMLGGSAQEYLVRSIPSEAVGGGFTRRVNFVFAKEKSKKLPWPVRNLLSTRDDLVEDLREIAQLRGEFTFNNEARRAFERYYDERQPDEFDDEATAGYKSSEATNVIKLATILSAARSDSLIIEEGDVQIAISRARDVADNLSIVFRAVGESPLIAATAKVLEFIEEKAGYASRKEILARNWHHTTADDLDKILATLREGGIIGERSVGKKTLYFITTKGATNP